MRNRIGMRVKSVVAALGGAALVMGLFAPAGDAEAAAVTGIRATRHNLVSSTVVGANTFTPTSGSGEICVFCHTPHGANTTVGVALWNKATPATTYNLYDSSSSSTIDGEVAPVGSVSMACLSCHDGTQALNAMINQPGSGANISGTGLWPGTWVAGTGATPVVPATGKLGTGIANLDTDLRNDHPIGIQYCGGGHTVASGVGTCKDGDFNLPQVATVGSTKVFWVDSENPGGAGNAARNKTDMILYNRTDFATAAAGPAVECATCHDPHTENQTFLRKLNDNSNVCLTCHIK